MPRPNHNVPSWVLGGVADYADEQDISRDEAHTELLKMALRDAGIIPGCNADGDE